jgi:hypothetical protein
MSAKQLQLGLLPLPLHHPAAQNRSDPAECSGCGTDLYCLGYKVEVPRKLDVRGWRQLHLDCRKRVLASSDEQAIRRVRVIHTAEREIARLRALGPAKGRQKIIRELEVKARA